MRWDIATENCDLEVVLLFSSFQVGSIDDFLFDLVKIQVQKFGQFHESRLGSLWINKKG